MWPGRPYALAGLRAHVTVPTGPAGQGLAATVVPGAAFDSQILTANRITRRLTAAAVRVANLTQLGAAIRTQPPAAVIPAAAGRAVGHAPGAHPLVAKLLILAVGLAGAAAGTSDASLVLGLGAAVGAGQTTVLGVIAGHAACTGTVLARIASAFAGRENAGACLANL